ncbi:MAG: bacteriohemerythrin [Burkholderiales bacterium]
MSLLLWNDALATGIPVVDAQHRRFVELINAVAPAADAPNAGEPTLAPQLDELVEYARMHFAEEEALMARVGLDPRALAHHHRQHERLAQRLATLRSDFAAGQVEASYLLSFLAGWLVFHILGEDQAMARQLYARAGGASPADAYTLGRGDDTHPSRDALNRTLVEAYTRLNRQNRELSTVNRQLEDHQVTLYRQQEDLEALVRERTAALEALAKDLSRSRDLAEAGSRAKSRFLAIVSHELRTPMNAVCGFTQLLRESGLDASQDALAQALERATDRMMQLVERIVDYAGDDDTATTGDERAAFSPVELLEETCAPFRRAARQKGVAFELALDRALPPLARGPVAELQRIVAELVDNAVKFTSDGGVQVTVHAEPTARSSVAHLVLRVRDSGCGLTQRQAARLFQPFAQADDTAGRRHEGLGIGLALAKRLADRIGATLHLTRSSAEGSEFGLDVDLEISGETLIQAVDTPAPPAAVAMPGAPAQAGAPAGAPLGVDQWMQMLCALLARGDTSASAVVRAAPPAVVAALGARLADIVQHTDTFDYDGAIALLRQAPLPHAACAEEAA